MTKIKVLHISQATGGVQRHIIQLLPRLSRERFEVTGICPPEDLIKGISADKQSFPQAFKNIGTEVHTVVMSREINPAFDLAAFFKIYGFLRKRKFDIVHTHSSKAGFLGRIAARLAGVPVIVHTPHSMAFDNPVMMPIQRSFYMFLEKVAGLFCDKIIAVCKGEKELIAGSGVAPGDKIEVINNGVDPALYDKRVDTSAKRKELGLKDSDKVVALVGRMSVQKAPFDFIKAALAVRKEFSDAVFLLLGDGPLLDAVRKYVAGGPPRRVY
ncbi:MAG: glycosyltransferase [Candidatus Omnitrophota bacterium]